MNIVRLKTADTYILREINALLRQLSAGHEKGVTLIARARIRGGQDVNLTSRPSRRIANALYKKIGFKKRNTNVYRFVL